MRWGRSDLRASRWARQPTLSSRSSTRPWIWSLSASAKRAGFDVIYAYALDQVASFRWGEGDPDFTFFVSFSDPEAVLVNADSYGDILPNHDQHFERTEDRRRSQVLAYEAGIWSKRAPFPEDTFDVRRF
jgi:hypothetical protein